MNNTPFTYLKPKSPEDIEKSLELIRREVKDCNTSDLIHEWMSTTSRIIEHLYEDELKIRAIIADTEEERKEAEHELRIISKMRQVEIDE